MLFLQCSRRTLLSSSSTTVVRKTERRREDVFLNISAQVPLSPFPPDSAFFCKREEVAEKGVSVPFPIFETEPRLGTCSTFLPLSLSLSTSLCRSSSSLFYCTLPPSPPPLLFISIGAFLFLVRFLPPFPCMVLYFPSCVSLACRIFLRTLRQDGDRMKGPSKKIE